MFRIGEQPDRRRNRFARQPVIVEIEAAADDAVWTQLASPIVTLGSRMRVQQQPSLYVRAGVLPGKDEEGWHLSIEVRSEAEPIDVPLRNVIGLLPGTDRREEFVVVSAHYDHIGTGRPVEGDGIYNGADDDATGTTAVITLAEALTRMPRPDRSILFVAFSAEERGLLGSREFVATPPIKLGNIAAHVNLEMLGRPAEDKRYSAWITGPRYSDFASIARTAMKRAGIELIDFRLQDALFRQSDNWSLVEAGVIAHSISAGSLHRDYHQPSDEIEKIDLEHMTRVDRSNRQNRSRLRQPRDATGVDRSRPGDAEEAPATPPLVSRESIPLARPMLAPPSTWIVWPVKKPDSSARQNAIAPAISAGRPNRCIGTMSR